MRPGKDSGTLFAIPFGAKDIIETRGHVQDGKVAHWQVTLKVGFTLE